MIGATVAIVLEEAEHRLQGVANTYGYIFGIAHRSETFSSLLAHISIDPRPDHAATCRPTHEVIVRRVAVRGARVGTRVALWAAGRETACTSLALSKWYCRCL